MKRKIKNEEIAKNEEVVIEEKNEPVEIEEEKVEAKAETEEVKSNKAENFFKKAFSFDYIALSLSIISIFFSFFTAFLPLATYSIATLCAAAAFFFLAFGCAFAALVIEAVKMIKGGYKFNPTLLIVILALVISAVVAPMTMNMNMYY